MFTSKTLVGGKFYPNDITISFNPSSTNLLPKDIEQQIDNKWDELSNEAKSKGMTWFNGNIYCLSNFQVNDKKLSLELGLSDFKHNQCELFIPDLITLGETYFIKTIFVSSILITKDNKYVLGKRGAKLNYRKDFDMIGGVLEYNTIPIEDSMELFNALHTEFMEEIGLEVSHIKNEYLRFIILTDSLRAGIFFQTHLDIESHILQEVFKENNDKEMIELLYLSKDEFISMLKTLTNAKVLLAQEITEDL